jgi:hypothetical protein
MAATPKGLSDEKAARMMVALREGRTLRKFGVKSARLEAYFAAHPEYAEEVRPLIEANAKAAGLRKGAHHRNKTHCKNGHPFAVYGRPNMNKGCMTRQCRLCDYHRIKRGGLIKPEMVVKVRTALERGLTIRAITTGDRATRLVPHHAFSRYRRENPEFDRFVLEMSKDNNSRGQRRRHQRLRNVAIREQNTDYHQILAMVPRHLSPDMRDDVAQSIFVALLEGSLRRDEVIKRLPEFVAAHNRDASRCGTGKFGLISIDAPMFAESSTTLADTITSGLWD